MNANEYDAWMRSRPKPKAPADDHVSQPIMPGVKPRKRAEGPDRFEGFRPAREHSVEPERT
jgi:hypothetical protein